MVRLIFPFRYANERYGTEFETKETILNHNNHTLQHSQKYNEWRFRLAVNYESDIRNEAKCKGAQPLPRQFNSPEIERLIDANLFDA